MSRGGRGLPRAAAVSVPEPGPDTIGNIEQELLIRRLLSDSVLAGDFVLADGARTTWKIDLSRTAYEPHGMLLIAQAVLARLPDVVSAIGGPLGTASPIVVATAAIAATTGRMLKTFLVDSSGRGECKTWGLMEAGEEVALIDAAVFTGQSLIQAARHVEYQGAMPVALVALFDGLGPCRENAAREGFDYYAICDKADLGLP